eukprot:1136394-Pelagomonas_calceolata.AAC.9
MPLQDGMDCGGAMPVRTERGTQHKSCMADNLHLDQGFPKYGGLRMHDSADGASLGASGDGGGPGIEPSWR